MTYSMTRDELEREVDLALAGSFPASDPPPWTFGAAPVELEGEPSRRPPASVAPAAVDVVIAATRGRRRAAAMAEAMAMTALAPAAVLAAAAPILLVVWGVGAAAAWLFGR